MSLSNFDSFALSKDEMKNVVGGTVFCGCTKHKNGASLQIHYTANDYCSAPGGGFAGYTYSYNGKTQTGSFSDYNAAELCGFSGGKQKQWT